MKWIVLQREQEQEGEERKISLCNKWIERKEKQSDHHDDDGVRFILVCYTQNERVK